MIVCYARCWPCTTGQHYDPPTWHTWADADDTAHALAAGHADPRQSRCGCHCADAPTTTEETPDA